MKRNIFFLVSFVFLMVTSLGRASSQEWKEYKKLHFIIYYNDAPLEFVKDVHDAAEEYYTDIMHNLGFVRLKSWNWNQRAKIYIYDSQENFAESSNRHQWAAGTASARLKVIRTFPSASGFFDSTLPHELGHIIFHEFIGIDTIVPLWFEEGVAMYQEKAKRWGSNNIVRKAIDAGEYMTIGELTSLRLHKSSRETVRIFYAEAASIFYYLMKEGTSYRFEAFCRRLKKGEEFYAAFKRTYPQYKTMEKLNKQWIDHITK